MEVVASEVTISARARRLTWQLPLAASLAWAVVVAIGGWWGRVVDQWESAVTMLFGSFLAGSSPEGGGAVAFPVLTKGLDVPAAVARSFGLFIQAVGMTMAAVTILVMRRPFVRWAAVLGGAAGIGGLVFGIFVLGESDEPFWPATVGAPWIKAVFSVVLATTALLMVLHQRQRWVSTTATDVSNANRAGVAVAAALGGALSSFTGTGANIGVFLFLVVVLAVDPKVALPTAIMVMAAVSIVGLIVLGLADGQLDVTVAGERVATVAGQPVDLARSQADLLGLWLAAVPVVVWGAPLGSWAAAQVSEATLVRFVAVLAATEVATTFLLVPELRTDPWLLLTFIGGLAVAPALLLWLRARRLRFMA